MTSQTATAKRPAPLSVRLSHIERRELEKLAGDQSLGTFIKERIFSDTPKSSSTTVADKYELLARVLASLGDNAVFANLDVIAKAIEAGDLTLSEDQENEIGAACLLVLEMRNDLIRALGLKPPTISSGMEAS